MKCKIYLIVLLFISTTAFAQNIAITDVDAYSPEGTAMLDVNSANKGLLVPRVALVNVNSPINAPATGLLVWNTSTSGNYPSVGFYYFDGANWIRIGGVSNLPLPVGEIYVGDASGNAATVSLSGDATITTAGVLTVGKIGGDNFTTDNEMNFSTSGVGAVNLTLPAGTFTVATLSGIEILTNKTITSPKINNILDVNNKELLKFNTVGSAENFVQIANSTSGNPPAISVEGTDANIDLLLSPKVNGSVQTTKIRLTDGALDQGFLKSDASGNGTWTLLTENDIPGLSTSKITNGVFNNARINWASPGNIGATTPAEGKFSLLNINNQYSFPVSQGANGQVLTADGTGGTSWQNGSGDMIGSNNLNELTDPAVARTELGLGDMALQAPGTVAITGGAISGTTITGGSINNVPIGSTTQSSGAFSSLQLGTSTTDGFVLTANASGVGTWKALPAGEVNTATNVGVSGADVFKQKNGTELEFRRIDEGSNMVTVNVNVDDEVEIDIEPTNITQLGTITTGTWNASVVPIAYGGTNAANASDARNNLGAQQNDADLTTIAGFSHVDGNIMVSKSGSWVLENGLTARTSLGIGTIATQNVNSVSITGGSIEDTDIGTSIPAAGAFSTLRLTTSPIANYVLTADVSGNATWQAAPGETNTASNVGTAGFGVYNGKTGVNFEFRNISVNTTTNLLSAVLTGANEIQLDLQQTNITELGTITTGTWAATDVAVLHGGTGASDASGARTNLGLVIGTNIQAFNERLAEISAIAAPTADNFIIGDGSDLILATPASARTSLGLDHLVANQAPKTVYAGPASLPNAVPSFRQLSSSDLSDAIELVTRTGTQTLTNKTLTSPILTTPLLRDASSNELLDLTSVGTPVNQLGITNAASGSGPIISANGDEANVDLNLTAKGTGNVNITGGLKTSGAVYRNVTTGTTIDGSTHVVIAGAAVTLPAASANSGREIIVKSSAGGGITVDRTGTDKIDGANSYSITGTGSATFISNGSDWYIIAVQ